MAPEIKSFEFEEFTLDVVNHELFRSGERVPVTPKVFRLLCVLVENRPHVMRKDELMDAVWPDSFVEESNLTFTVRQLRKTLGDCKEKPRFVETVPRRGYRFIAPMRTPNSRADDDTGTKTVADRRRRRAVWTAFAALAIVLLVAGGILIGKRKVEIGPEYPILSRPYSSEALSPDGRAGIAAISPSARFVAYVGGANLEQPGVWVKELSTGNQREIIPSGKFLYGGLAVSRDESSLYFARKELGSNEAFCIYRTPVAGGVPFAAVCGTEGWFSLSKDGADISFVRCPKTKTEYCSLYLADANGKQERKLVTRPFRERISANSISNDGEYVAFGAGQSETESNDFGLYVVNIKTGVEREIADSRFYNIKGIAWLPDDRNILFTGLKSMEANSHFWLSAVKTGVVIGIRPDSIEYGIFSLDQAATSLVSTAVSPDFRLHIFNPERTSSVLDLGAAAAVQFMPDGSLLFSSIKTGNASIGTMNPDGSGERQLTLRTSNDGTPIYSATGKLIYFESNRTGKAQIWRMKPDGSDPVQITKNTGGWPIAVSSDNESLFYRAEGGSTIWKVSLSTGQEELLFENGGYTTTFSPDGSQAATVETVDGKLMIKVVSTKDKTLLRYYPLPGNPLSVAKLEWSMDGRQIFYILQDSDQSSNVIWRQPVDGSKPIRTVDIGVSELGERGNFAVSPDGKTFAVVYGKWNRDAVLITGLR